MRVRRWWVALAVSFAALLAAVVGFSPLVRAKAQAQAERRGMTLEIDQVRPGWGRVWLRGSVLRIPMVPAVEIDVDHVEVRLGVLLDVREVVAHGGRIRVRGEPAEVSRQVEAWRAGRSGGSGGQLSYRLDGVDLEWAELAAGAEPQYAWGLHYSRSGDEETVGANLIRAEVEGAAVELSHPRAVVMRRDGRRVLEKLTADAVSATIDLGAGPLQGLVEGAPTAPAKSASRPEPAVRRAGGLPKKTEPGAAKLDGVGRSLIDPTRGPRFRQRLERVAAFIADAMPQGSELDLDGVVVRIQSPEQGFGIGPARLRAQRGKDSAVLALISAPTAENPLKLELDLPFDRREVHAAIDGGPVTLGALGVKDGDLGLTDVERSKIEARLKATLSAAGDRVTWSGRGRATSVSVKQAWLAPRTVRGLDLALSGRGELSLDASAAKLDDAELEVGQIRAQLEGSFERGPAHTRFVIEGGVPLAACQAMLDSSPEGLTPLLAGMRMSGTFSLTGKIEIDTRRLEDMVLRWQVANECRITGTPADVAPRKFAQSWGRQVLGADGKPTNIQSGPGTLGWVPRDAISKHMETAVLICEDGAFFRHQGFDHEAIRNSIRENIKAGHFVRGASTISMQLAKNLYLPREKTLARKLQEAVLTMLLEQELTKDQMMELYLNVIEFGPGIYGVGPAAQHYFNSTATQLSLGQSLYLGSILPNPKLQYFGANGAVTPGWTAYLQKLMRIAHKIRRVTEPELEDGLTEQVTFKVPYSPRAEPGDQPASATPEHSDVPLPPEDTGGSY